MDGLPFVVEVAIAETTRAGGLLTGVNFSPTFGDPLAETRLEAGEVRVAGTRNFLQQTHVFDAWTTDRPTVAAVHLVCPSLEFLERGKSRLQLPAAMSEVIADTLWRAAQDLYREGKQREKEAAREQEERAEEARREQRARSRAGKRLDAVIQAHEKEHRRKRWSRADAVFEVLEEAMSKASGDGQYPVSARTLYYQVRPLIQQYTDDTLEYRLLLADSPDGLPEAARTD